MPALSSGSFEDKNSSIPAPSPTSNPIPIPVYSHPAYLKMKERADKAEKQVSEILQIWYILRELKNKGNIARAKEIQEVFDLLLFKTWEE